MNVPKLKELDKNELEKEGFEIIKLSDKYKGSFIKLDNSYFLLMMSNVANIKNIEIRNDDVFSIGYPKSGTSWLEEMIWLLQNNLNYELKDKIHHLMRIPFIDSSFIPHEALNKMESPRVLKTHVHYEMLPKNIEKKCKVKKLY